MVPPAGLAPGWFHDQSRMVVGHQGVRVSRRVGAGGVAGWGSGSRSFSCGGSILTPTPSPLRDKLADATGYPHPAPPILRQANTSCVPLTTVNNGAP